MGRNGWSSISRISRSVLARPSLLRLASSFLSITLAAKRAGGCNGDGDCGGSAGGAGGGVFTSAR